MTKDLGNPDSVAQLWRALGATYESWISYVVSSYVFAQFWLTHYQVFRGIQGRRDGLAAWNFVFLFTISVMPFASDLIGEIADNPLAIISSSTRPSPSSAGSGSPCIPASPSCSAGPLARRSARRLTSPPCPAG